MKKIFKITEHPIIATLLTTAILAIIGTINFTTLFDTSIQWLKTTFNSLLNNILFVLNYEVSIWKIIVFFGVIVFASALFIKWKAQKNHNTESVSQNGDEVAINQETTTELENKILYLFKHNYNTGYSIPDIDRRLQINNMLLTEQTVENLTYDKHLLERYEHFMEGITFYLSNLGRDYVLANEDLFS